jgi:hypothetical protein
VRISPWPAGLALFLSGCFQDSAPKHSDYLPLSYPTGFPIVRNCRLVADHQNTFELVRANQVAADPYTIASYPLPQGSVVIAEQHSSDPFCDSLSGYYLMAKEQAGYYGAGGDWHWQDLDLGQRVIEDGRLQKCASCHADCAASDFLCARP